MDTGCVRRRNEKGEPPGPPCEKGHKIAITLLRSGALQQPLHGFVGAGVDPASFEETTRIVGQMESMAAQQAV